MLEHFQNNSLFLQRLNEAGAKKQFLELIEFTHGKGLDWYFTDIPDLRCGRKEIESRRASSVCFSVWFENLSEVRIRQGQGYGLKSVNMPLAQRDFSRLKRHISVFVKDYLTNLSRPAFFPDEYPTLSQDATSNDPLDTSIKRMITTMLGTVANSNGQQVTITIKNKETDLTEKAAKALLRKLFDDQDGLCAVSNIPLELDSAGSKSEFACSLDRIDSNGDYEVGNLQIVCKFINRWKSNSPDNEFRDLIGRVKAAP